MPTSINKTKLKRLQNKLKDQGVLEVEIVSGSMEPYIKVGQLIEIEPIRDFSSLKMFDVLVFWNGDFLVCHYLFHINKTILNQDEITFVTKALNGPGEDLPIFQSQILGRMKGSIPLFLRLKEMWKIYRRR